MSFFQKLKALYEKGVAILYRKKQQEIQTMLLHIAVWVMPMRNRGSMMIHLLPTRQSLT